MMRMISGMTSRCNTFVIVYVLASINGIAADHVCLRLLSMHDILRVDL